jgi:hypothetical protein
MQLTLTPSRHPTLAIVSTLVIAFVLTSARPASAQWDPRDAALSRCQQELQYRISREAGGRQPDASIDERRAQISQLSNNETRVRGTGRYIRDHNDRGRDFTFDCTYNNRNNSARATYNWSGSGWGGGQYPDPDPGYGRPPAGGYPPTDRVFFSGGIVSRLSNKCLDVEGGSNRNEANVQQWSCSGGSNQLWDVIDLGRGEYSIVNQRSNKALTVAGGGSDGANIEQNRWSGGDNQRWHLERAGNGAYRIISKATRSCLDVEGAKREDGANIQTWGCSGGANQAWLFRK